MRAGFLPPISVMHGFGYSRLKRWISSMPTVLLPVKSMPSTEGWLARACPVISPLPKTRCRAPSGTPASMRMR